MNDLSQAEIRLLQQISDSLAHLNSRMESSERLQLETLERLVKLEVSEAHTAKIEDRIDKIEQALTNRANNHSDRISSLEAARNRIEGATGLVEWLNKLWPLFAAAIGLLGIYVAYQAK